MTQKALAAAIGMQPTRLSHLIHGRVRITPDIAMQLEHALGIPAHIWNNLQNQYDMTAPDTKQSQLTVTLDDPSRLTYIRRAISRLQGVRRVSVL